MVKLDNVYTLVCVAVWACDMALERVSIKWGDDPELFHQMQTARFAMSQAILLAGLIAAYFKFYGIH